MVPNWLDVESAAFRLPLKLGARTRCVSMYNRGSGRRGGEGGFSSWSQDVSRIVHLERCTGVGTRPTGLYPVTQRFVGAPCPPPLPCPQMQREWLELLWS